MKYTEFKNSLENGKVFPIYIFEGEDSFFSSNGLKLLKSKFILEPSLNCVELYPESTSLKDIFSSLDCIPFLSERRMTVIRDYYPKADELKKIAEYFKNPSPTSILVVINEKPLEGFKKIKDVCNVECVKLDANTLARWVKGECANNGIAVDLETSRLLVDYCLCDMMRINNETQKLCAYVLDKKVIEKEDVENLVDKGLDNKIFKMTEFIGLKQFDKAISIINEMLSRGETPQGLLAYLYSYFRRMLHVAISEKSDAELSSLLKSPDYLIRKIRQQSAMFKKRAIKTAVDTMADADARFKSGITDVNDELWFSVFKIMVS